MAIRTFSSTPRFFGEFNVTLPTVSTVSTAEVGVTAAGQSGTYGQLNAETMIVAHPTVAGTGAVAFPAGLGFSHAYYNSTDGKIYFRFVNPAAADYTAAAIITVRVIGF